MANVFHHLALVLRGQQRRERYQALVQRYQALVQRTELFTNALSRQDKQLILSAVNRVPSENYNLEVPNFNTNFGTRWCGPPGEIANIGDFLAFVHHTTNRMNIFVIIDIGPHCARDYWDANWTQDRQCFSLSRMLEHDMSWSEYKRLCGYSAAWWMRGTRIGRMNGYPVEQEFDHNCIELLDELTPDN